MTNVGLHSSIVSLNQLQDPFLHKYKVHLMLHQAVLHEVLSAEWIPHLKYKEHAAPLFARSEDT